MKDGVMRKYVFAGNRFYVLREMLNLNLNVVKIFAHKNSYLEKELIKNNIEYELIQDKQSLIEKISNIEFDYFISNGLSYILPISKLSTGNKKFINIHPSYLPDLKGKNPIQAAILFKRDMGATCHYMDDGIDTGNIISQIKIPYSSEFDAGLLYKLAFNLEAKVFNEAYNNNFVPQTMLPKINNPIYYSVKEKDNYIDINSDSVEAIIKKIKAFSTLKKGAIVEIDNQNYNVIGANVIQDRNIIKLINEFKISRYENYILINKDDLIIKFMLNPNFHT